MKELVIDAKGAVLGRLASYSAKQALLGNKVVIVNCENIEITGKPKTTIREYRDIRSKGGASLHGPFFPKHPERIVKRTIRGMLAHRQSRGNDALKRIMCYNEIPEKYKDVKKIHAAKEKNTKTIKLKLLSKEI